jgi:hypothetical protein
VRGRRALPGFGWPHAVTHDAASRRHLPLRPRSYLDVHLGGIMTAEAYAKPLTPARYCPVRSLRYAANGWTQDTRLL